MYLLQMHDTGVSSIGMLVSTAGRTMVLHVTRTCARTYTRRMYVYVLMYIQCIHVDV